MTTVNKSRRIICLDLKSNLEGLAFATVENSWRRKASVFGTSAMERNIRLRKRVEIIEKK